MNSSWSVEKQELSSSCHMRSEYDYVYGHMYIKCMCCVTGLMHPLV